MLLNLDSSFLIIIIVSYVLYLIISNKFININRKDKNKEIKEGFEDNQKNLEKNLESIEPKEFDLYDKKYKPILKKKTDEICIDKVKSDCLPYSINSQQSGEKQFKELSSDISNLLGQNFLNAKHHSQVDNVGIYPRNKKVDIRPELINPQLGVDPWTQSIINIDWKNDKKILQNPNPNKNVWDRLV